MAAVPIYNVPPDPDHRLLVVIRILLAPWMGSAGHHPRRDHQKDHIMIFPTVHMGGTSKNSLLEALEDARTALRAAETALRETAPHGRDYYLDKNPDALKIATQEYIRRCTALAQVHEELLTLSENIVNQGT